MHKIDHLIQARLTRGGFSKKTTFHIRLANKVAEDLKVKEHLEGLTDETIFAATRPPEKKAEEGGVS